MSESTEKRHKRGDVREDGKVFWLRYRLKSGVWKEKWLSRNEFDRKKQDLSEYVKKYNQVNRDKTAAKARKYRAKHRDRLGDKWKAEAKAWREANKEYVSLRVKEWREQNKDRVQEAARKWEEENRGLRRANWRKYVNDRRKTDPLYALKTNLSTRVLLAFKSKRFIKPGGAGKLLGCTLEVAKTHIESKFQPGMSWENRGEWHIDHIIPLSSATTPEQMASLCHYTNLQPLWAKDNIRKGAKMPP